MNNPSLNHQHTLLVTYRATAGSLCMSHGDEVPIWSCSPQVHIVLYQGVNNGWTHTWYAPKWSSPWSLTPYSEGRDCNWIKRWLIMCARCDRAWRSELSWLIHSYNQLEVPPGENIPDVLSKGIFLHKFPPILHPPSLNTTSPCQTHGSHLPSCLKYTIPQHALDDLSYSYAYWADPRHLSSSISRPIKISC